ncbi:MAG: DedA family protein [Deltaproteobacteria bacterium]|nr:DedA family protein [Deltaproteobacteria bacterium]
MFHVFNIFGTNSLIVWTIRLLLLILDFFFLFFNFTLSIRHYNHVGFAIKERVGMILESLIDTYGYLAILVGTFLEGETILVIGGFAAHRGYLHLPLVVLAAFTGTLMGDQFFFFLGRWRSKKILAKWPSLKCRVEKAEKLVSRYRYPFILVFRFLYGVRTAAPFVMGMSNVPAPLFVLLNAIGASMWAIAVGVAGYLFGDALELLLGDVRHYEVRVFGAIAALGAVIWAVHFISGRRKRRRVEIRTGRKQGALDDTPLEEPCLRGNGQGQRE